MTGRQATSASVSPFSLEDALTKPAHFPGTGILHSYANLCLDLIASAALSVYV